MIISSGGIAISRYTITMERRVKRKFHARCEVGEKLEIISNTYLSPYLSVAGARAGLDGSKSGLFFEAIRVIKEMREETNGEYPKYAIWENVPGAFSSSGGKDFATVLESFALLADKEAPSVPVPEKGWPTAGSLQDMDGGWSLAWRVFDAQHWGVPQRRRRIFLVMDFAGTSAREVLFKCESVSGNIETFSKQEEGITCSTEASFREPNQIRASEIDPISFHLTQDPVSDSKKTPCLGCGSPSGQATVGVCALDTVAATLRAGAGAPKHEADYRGRLVIDTKPFCIQGSMIGRTDKNGPQGNGINEDVSFTLNATDRHAVAYIQANNETGNIVITQSQSLFENHRADARYTGPLEISPTVCARYGTGGSNTPFVVNENVNLEFLRVRKLTPTECARLQGFPDWWGVLDPINDMSDEDYEFFKESLFEVGVIEGKITKDEVQGFYVTESGRPYKSKTKEQMIKWYNKLHSDSPEYKMWGNGVALPCVREPLHNMAKLGVSTLGSLFDGSGGFPLAGILENIIPLWSSEIAPYPSAVTKQNFNDIDKLKTKLGLNWRTQEEIFSGLVYQTNVGALLARDYKGVNTFDAESEKLVIEQNKK